MGVCGRNTVIYVDANVAARRGPFTGTGGGGGSGRVVSVSPLPQNEIDLEPVDVDEIRTSLQAILGESQQMAKKNKV